MKKLALTIQAKQLYHANTFIIETFRKLLFINNSIANAANDTNYRYQENILDSCKTS